MLQNLEEKCQISAKLILNRFYLAGTNQQIIIQIISCPYYPGLETLLSLDLEKTPTLRNGEEEAHIAHL